MILLKSIKYQIGTTNLVHRIFWAISEKTVKNSYNLIPF